MVSAKIVEGLQILAAYYDETKSSDKYWICAQHDEIYAGHAIGDAIGGDDKTKLEELGWVFDKGLDAWKAFT